MTDSSASSSSLKRPLDVDSNVIGKRTDCGFDRRGNDDVQWRLRISQANTFKTFMENIASVLGECAFQVVHTPDFQGISVESIDPTRVCLLQGRLSGDVFTADNVPATFCVRMPPLLAFLRSISPSFFVDMWCAKGATDVSILLFEPLIGTHQPLCHIKTLAKSQETCQLDELEFDIFVEIELQIFRTTIKTARDHHADAIKIAVYTPKRAEGFSSGLRTHIFVISYEGDETSCEFPFQSSTEMTDDEEDGPTIIKASETTNREFDVLPPLSERNVIYEGKFGCEPINNFVKNLERTNLTISLGKDRPLLLEYPLGSSIGMSSKEGKDYIRFICAPRSE